MNTYILGAWGQYVSIQVSMYVQYYVVMCCVVYVCSYVRNYHMYICIICTYYCIRTYMCVCVSYQKKNKK